ncbi:MORN repeat-containing protein, putative [Perkinsus marinus ATCC 50983]|uniref:MORN repeat-containing protein, putative n=1 Tax=Perkinsus marinus (strain ATCC 50983 / TXsc) TaxID=423536 RepID=C5LBL1_PERM5|nr:MORN repeat-containing protein, putative [Perkinsus marinus ATCC 50983]EER05832.1 MORN repeat-containing protein, putative [Perkinsus marinus ATCC 50983]|eukprot:XP_002774016.1 MORN repeat-containing protein, putative [Perkinsus marinus ATCC 50983]
MYPDRIISYYGTFAGQCSGGEGVAAAVEESMVAGEVGGSPQLLEDFKQNDDVILGASVLPSNRDGISLVGEAVDMSLLMRETETYCGELLKGRPHGRGVKRVPVPTLVGAGWEGLFAAPTCDGSAARDGFSRSLSSTVSGGTVFTAFTAATTTAGSGGRGVRRPRSWVKELEVYDGQWLHGLKHGEGRMEFRDGVVYEGEWREDLRHGRGVQVIDAASKTRLLYGYVKYDGEWDGGVRSGEGKIELTDGSVYEGMFEMNQRHDPRGDGREGQEDSLVSLYEAAEWACVCWRAGCVWEAIG